MRNILFLTDPTTAFNSALRYAISFFAEAPCTFYHLCLKPDTIATGSMEQVEGDISSILDSYGHQYHLLREEPHSISRIKEKIRKYRIALIIMPKTPDGTRPFSDTLGVHSLEIISKVNCPLLLIPRNAIYQALAKMVIPTDFNMRYSARLLGDLCATLELHHARALLLTMERDTRLLNLEQKMNGAYLLDVLESYRPEVHYGTSTSLADSLQTLIVEKNVGLIGLIAKNIHFLREILSTTLENGNAYQKRIPFLILHD